ncbi:MAG: Gfo/Idh/MocA family oxidoreductase [Alphaproteobacteria bacterium]|nr:Gfo/Idh/MocA family oxidoreductase [Alphaproteobacteria bacterium]
MGRRLMLSIGLIGAGGNTIARHIPGFLSLEDVTIRGVCNRSIESARAVADKFDIQHVYHSWQDLLADDAIDAVCIGTWPDTHCNITLAALAAGKHVLCEARMAMNAEEAYSMLGAANRNPQLVAQLVPSPFSLGIDDIIRGEVSSGRIGNLLAIDVHDRNASFIDSHSGMTWRQDILRSGNNVLYLGIVYEAMMRWIGRADRVFANARTFVKQRPDEYGKTMPLKIPDHLDVLADFECGCAANMRFSNVTGMAPSGQAWIFGSEATLRLDFEEGLVMRGRRGDNDLINIAPPLEQQPKWRVEESFINAIRRIEPVRLTTFEDGVRYMEFTDAVAQSWRREQWVDVGRSQRAL